MEAESLAESESEESSDLVWIGTTEATGAEAESEEKEHLILLTPIPSSFRLHFRFPFWFTLDRNAPYAPDSDSASDSIASVNQPLHGTANKVKSLKGYWVRYWSKTKVITLARDNQLNQSKLEPSDAKHVLVTTGKFLTFRLIGWQGDVSFTRLFEQWCKTMMAMWITIDTEVKTSI